MTKRLGVRGSRLQVWIDEIEQLGKEYKAMTDTQSDSLYVNLPEAKRCANAALAEYGEFTLEECKRYEEHGIWNDHPAVQAALLALKGPPGYATWNDAAVAERLKRVEIERRMRGLERILDAVRTAMYTRVLVRRPEGVSTCDHATLLTNPCEDCQEEFISTELAKLPELPK